MNISGYLFEIYNKGFTSITSPDINRITLTIIDRADRKKLINQIKQHNNKYTFSVFRATEINHRALNLTILLPKSKYPFLSCIFDPALLHRPISEWFGTKFKTNLRQHKMTRVDGPAHIWYNMRSIEIDDQ